MKKTILVPESAKGHRIDKFLGSLPEIQSRSRATLLIDRGAVRINALTVKSSFVLKGNEEIIIDLPSPNSLELRPLDLPLEILFEDEFLLVLNKPAGLVVHPAAGHFDDTLVNALIAHSQTFAMKFGEIRPGIVHRLDKDTSGLMVVAKSDPVQEILSMQFRERTIQRHYLAVVRGLIQQKEGSIKSYLARHPSDRKRFASVRNRQKKIITDPLLNPGIGKWAQTDYKVLAYHPRGFSYVRLKLQTGRTHQIRVHLSEIGHPILGDETYGEKSKLLDVPRFALHAAELGFVHPVSQAPMHFERDWPEDYRSLILDLFGKGTSK